MKTLIKKSTKQWATYQLGFMWTGEFPILLAETATMENLRLLHDEGYGEKELDGKQIEWDDYEIIDVTIIVNTKLPTDNQIKNCGEQWKEALGQNPYRIFSDKDFQAGATWMRDLLC